MTAQYVESHVSRVSRDMLLRQLRPNLLALKQFEQCYILARWIRNLFIDIMDQAGRTSAAETPQGIQTPHAQPLLATDANTGSMCPLQQRQIPFPVSSILDSSSLNCGGSLGRQFFFDTQPPSGNTHDFAMPDGFQRHLDFPSPTSLEYQELSFLADLGFSTDNQY